MKFHSILHSLLAFSLAGVFSSCDPDPEITYPVAYDYQGTEIFQTHWYVLTQDAQNELAQVPYAAAFDAEIKDAVDEFSSDFPIQRIELLSDTKAKLSYIDGGVTFDTILPYSQVQDVIKIVIGQSPEETIQFYSKDNPKAIYLGLAATYYSHKLANGTVDYSPIELNNSAARDAIKILNELRQSEQLMPGDTVTINTSALAYKN